jgi:hypothetical protein
MALTARAITTNRLNAKADFINQKNRINSSENPWESKARLWDVSIRFVYFSVSVGGGPDPRLKDKMT